MPKLTTLIAIACVGVSASARTHDVFFGTTGAGSEGIYRSVFDTEKGKLGEATLAAKIGSPGFLAMDSAQEHLYAAANDGRPCVAAYKISSDGKLTLINTEAIGDGGAAHISVHPSNKFLMTAQYGGGSVAVFPILPGGAVGERSQLIKHSGGSKVAKGRQDKPHPHWTGYSPDGRFAFVPDLGMDQVVIYKVGDDGQSIEAHGFGQALPGAGPRHMRFSVDGKFVYLLNELALSVSTFSYDADAGSMELLTTTPSLSEEAKRKEAFNSASEILVHPNGRFVYSGNRGNDSVTVYHAAPETGRLDVREVEPIRGSWPRNINLDPSGNWLLAAGQHSNTVSVFAIGKDDGELQFQTEGVASVPRAICIVFGK